MNLEEVQLTSKLSGVKYDSIQCSNCQDVFAIEAVNDCECGGTDNGEHLNWCSESDVEWPPINAADNNPQLAD